MTRQHKDVDWQIPKEVTSWDQVNAALLMDLRDQARETNRLLHELRALAGCFRIPRALDAMTELGLEARRRKRSAAKRKRRKAS